MKIKTDNYEIYKGDCLEVMDKLIEEGVKVDCILTDPPYGTTLPRVATFSSSLVVDVAILAGDSVYVASSVQNTGRRVERSSHWLLTMLL